MLPFSRRSAARLLAAGCAWWLWLAFARTRQVAERIGASPAEVRALGARDTVSFVALLTARNPVPAIWARILFDLSDFVRFGRHRRDVAAMTGGFAGLGLLALLGRSGR
jgi:cytosine/uracil/thiamine/allantoin permease